MQPFESNASPPPDRLDLSFSAMPPSLPPVKPATAADAAEQAIPSVDATPSIARVSDGLWGWVLPATFFLSVVVLVLYAAPYLLSHWRIAEAQAEADAAFLKRRAELKAEAEHADERLDLLDKRVHLASLGFREVVRKVAPNVVNVINMKEAPKAEDRKSTRLN